MKEYPSINGSIQKDTEVFIFDKLDGSNIRAEWSKKRGFYKFGSRRQMIDHTYPILGEAVNLIQNKYSDDITSICRKYKYDRITCFFEFLGEHSFGGIHENELHDVILFDVDVPKKGILCPHDFLEQFGHLDIPNLLYKGRVGQELIDKIRSNKLEGMTFEGVVCKTRRGEMFKIKSQAWYDKLRLRCQDDNQLFEQLK